MKNFIFALIFIVAAVATSVAQDKTTGGVKGKVRLTNGDSISGVTVEAKQGETVVASARTDKSGDFTIVGLKPGKYRFFFNKTGLSEGISPEIEIKEKQMLTLKRLIMAVDKGTQAVIRASVFSESGVSVSGAKVEVARLTDNGTRRVAETYTSRSGEFTFRLPPDAARYRFTVTIDGAEPAAKDFPVDQGAQIYRFSITLKAKP